MGNRKGQKHYPERIKQIIMAEQKEGRSVRSLSEKYGVSRYTIQSWCGLRPELNRARLLLGEYIHFYNYERIQLNKKRPLSNRLRSFVTITD